MMMMTMTMTMTMTTTTTTMTTTTMGMVMVMVVMMMMMTTTIVITTTIQVVSHHILGTMMLLGFQCIVCLVSGPQKGEWECNGEAVHNSIEVQDCIDRILACRLPTPSTCWQSPVHYPNCAS
eukprot:4840272-Amphidinium_carterae.1